MELSRKDFLKASLGAMGLVLFQPAGIASAGKARKPSDVAMLVDVTKCVSCWWCYAACKNYNRLPETFKPDPEKPPELAPDIWTTLHTLKRGNEWSSRKHACNHCTDAACVQVCPTGALSYNKLGFVQYDRTKCSGCGYCAEFCPRDVLEMGDELNHKGYRVAVIKDENRCVACGYCEAVCPEFAVRVSTPENSNSK